MAGWPDYVIVIFILSIPLFVMLRRISWVLHMIVGLPMFAIFLLGMAHQDLPGIGSQADDRRYTFLQKGVVAVSRVFDVYLEMDGQVVIDLTGGELDRWQKPP